MKSFKEYVVEAKNNYEKDPSNPNLTKAATGSLKSINAGEKVTVAKVRDGKVVSKTKYTMPKNTTPEDFLKQIKDSNPASDVEYKFV